MGNGDRRRSLKMRRLKSQAKFKIRHTYTGAAKVAVVKKPAKKAAKEAAKES